MLVIRMQRTGRKGHAQFRVVVQDSRRTPTSGKIVAPLGHFDPHTKTAVIDKEKASFYLEHGAQPSDRVARLLKSEGVKLPKWVQLESKKKRDIRNPEKLRANRPPEAEKPAEAPAPEEPAEDTPTAETSEAQPSAEPAEAESVAVEAPAEAEEPAKTEPAEDKPAE
jgi:small subunit ribosomal protein S16